MKWIKNLFTKNQRHASNDKNTEMRKCVTPYFENNVFIGARVNVGDEDFVVTPEDYERGEVGEEFTWDDAMNALKNEGLSTFNYRQVCLIMAYRKDIDRILLKNGGSALDYDYWTSEEVSTFIKGISCSAFGYCGYDGTMDYYNKKDFTFNVRPIKNLKGLNN